MNAKTGTAHGRRAARRDHGGGRDRVRRAAASRARRPTASPSARASRSPTSCASSARRRRSSWPSRTARSSASPRRSARPPSAMAPTSGSRAWGWPTWRCSSDRDELALQLQLYAAAYDPEIRACVADALRAAARVVRRALGRRSGSAARVHRAGHALQRRRRARHPADRLGRGLGARAAGRARTRLLRTEPSDQQERLAERSCALPSPAWASAARSSGNVCPIDRPREARRRRVSRAARVSAARLVAVETAVPRRTRDPLRVGRDVRRRSSREARRSRGRMLHEADRRRAATRTPPRRSHRRRRRRRRRPASSSDGQLGVVRGSRRARRRARARGRACAERPRSRARARLPRVPAARAGCPRLRPRIRRAPSRPPALLRLSHQCDRRTAVREQRDGVGRRQSSGMGTTTSASATASSA